MIAATSALELGIDVGDFGRRPRRVFLAAYGMVGAAREHFSNCLFLATSDEALLLSAALIRLHARGYVESVPLRTKAAHLLAHQLMALSIQEECVTHARRR
jgi:ATP-dependent Lhr-like helicase